MAKSSSRKSLKSLFSRSEANLNESPAKDVDKNDGEKKKFKFFRIKKKSSSGSASEKPVNEGQQVLYRAVDTTKENGETRTADNQDQKKTSLYATAPRSKTKELSYSETDLSKPKRFATFAFGLRKRKKKDGDILSKSAFGLQSTGIEEQEEPPPDLSKMELDQTIGKRFSMSEPELDTSGTFDIPSPPPVATNQSDSHFPLPEASQPPDSVNPQPEAKEPLINGSSFLEVHTEPLKAPIATIPELQLEGPDMSDLAKNDANSPALMTRTDTTSKQPLSTPPLEPNTVDLKAAVVDLLSSSNGPSDSDSHQNTKPETSPNQPDTSDVTDSATSNDKLSTASVDPKAGVTDIAGEQEVHIERGLPETVESGTTEKTTTPADHTEVYGALYESLFPQSFTSEVMSSILNHPPQAHTEIQCHTETSIVYSSLLSDESNKDNVADNLTVTSSSSERKVIPSSGTHQFTSCQTVTASELQQDQAVLNSVMKSPVPYSELSSSFSEVKSDSHDPIQSTVKPAPVAQSPPPPVSDYAASQGTDAQVTDPKRRVILVRELVTEETSSAPGCSSPGPEKMDTGNDLVSNTDTAKTFSDVPHRKLSLYDGALSPTYFSVGSDDGSAVDIYYSAEEDNIQDSGDEEIYKVDEKQEKRIADMAKEVTRALEEQSQQREIAETEINKKDEGGAKVLIVKMQSEESNDDSNSQAEVYHQSSETLAADLPEGNIVETNKKEAVTAVIPDVAEESKEVTLSEEISATKADEGGLRVVIVKMQNEDSNNEPSSSDVIQQSSDTCSAKILDEDAPITASSRVTTEVTEMIVKSEELLRQEKIAEEEPSLADEGGKRVLIVKMLSEEGDSSHDLKSQETEVVTEVVELREYLGDISKQGELPENVTNQTEEGGPRVVIVKMRSVESNEEEMGDSISQTEVQQQSEISEGKVATIQEDQVLAAESLEVAQEAGEVTELREFLHDTSKKEELPEGVTGPSDEGGHRVLIVKMLSKENIDEETGDTRNLTEVRQELREQILETLKTEIPDSNVVKVQEDKVEATGISEAPEEVTKEVTELREYIEDLSKKEELPEGMTSPADELGQRVVIVKMLSEESTDEETGDTRNLAEGQQELRGQILHLLKTEIPESNVVKIQEDQVEATGVSEGPEEVKKDVVELREYIEDISKKRELPEGMTSPADEVVHVVIVKMQSQENTEEDKEDTRHQTEVQQQPTDQISDTLGTELLKGNSPEHQKDATAIAVSADVVEEVEEVTAESEDTKQPVFLNVEEELKELKEGLCEDFQEEGQETNQQSIEDKKEEIKEEEGNQTELQNNIKIQVSETLVLEGLDSKILGEEVTTKAMPEVKEVVGLIEEASENIEITEKETITKDVDFNKEKEEETRHQNEAEKQPSLQNLETLTLGINQEDKPAISTSPEVAEEVEKNEDNAVKEAGEVEISLETGTSGGLEGNNDKIVEAKMPTSNFQEVSEGVKVAVELPEEVSQKGEIEEQEMSRKDEESEVEKTEQLSMSGMHNVKTPEKDATPPALPEVAEDKSEVTCLLKDSNIIKDGEGKSLEKAAAINADPEMAEEVGDVIKLCENFSKNGAEKQTLLKDQEGKTQKEEENKYKVEVQPQLRGQRSTTVTSRFLELCYMNPLNREIATTAYQQVKKEGEEERKEEFLAAPVGQVKTLMVCDFAPPSSKLHGLEEGFKGNQAKELVIEDHPKEAQQLPRQEAQYVAHKDVRSSEYIYAASSNSSRAEERITPLFREAEKQVSLLAEANKKVNVSTETNSSTTSAVTDTRSVVQVVTNSTERQSDATQIGHNRAAQDKTEWADTITQSTVRTSKAKEQVAVKLSTTIEDAQLPDTKAADTSSKTREPADSNPDLDEGSPTVSEVLTVTAEILTAANPPDQVDQELDDEMMSGYSSLSTKLSFKTSSPPKEDETKYRVHKLSLTNESDSKESSKDAVDSVISNSTVSESNGSDVDPTYRWRNRFEGVAQFKSSNIEEFSSSDSLSYTDTYSSPSSLSSLSSTSTLPEATTYKHVSNASFSSASPSADDQITLSSRLSDRSEVYLSRESEPAAGESTDERRRGLAEREEPAAPAGEREREGEAERFKTSWESHLSPVSSHDGADQTEITDDSTRFTGVFKATLVELVSDPTAPPPPTSTPPASPDIDSPNQFDMDSLVDTLKNMGPTMRPRGMGAIRPPAPVLHSSLPPIKEDAPSPISMDVRDSINSPLKKMEALNKPAEPLNGLYTLPADLGLKRNTLRDSRSPLELMKQSQQEQLVNSPLRASATNSIVMRRNSDSSVEDLHPPLLNGNGQSPGTTSRLDNSVIFGSYRSGSIDQKQENRQAHRQLFRTNSLPESGPPNDHTKDFSNLSTGSNSIDQTGSRLDRYAFLLNSPSSQGSLTGAEDLNMRLSRPPTIGIGSPTSSNSPNRLLSPTGSINLDHSVSMFGQNQGLGMTSPPLLQRSFSSEGIMGVQQTPVFNGSFGGSQFQSQEQERNLVSKYRAFPDAYLTKEKEHGKLNPRPGKIYIFDQPGMCGQRIEVGSDVMDATSWELQETISIRVVRGGWVLYEKPNYKGEKIALDEGDIELTYPFISPEEEQQNGQQPQNGQQEGQKQNGDTSEVQTENKPARKFIIGSLRRAVRDYSVPEISLFPEENAEGKKVIFRDTSEDARIFGFPIKATSIIINAGLWLVYAHPFFQGVPRVLEVGGYTNPAAWGVEQPYVGSLHPLKVGEPRVENLSEPKIVIYDKPYFTGKSRTVTTNSRDFMTRVDRQQTAFMYNVGSMKVLGGIWVGYEKEGYRGHQYLLEEGEYQDWRVWGGCDAELRSVRVIRADLSEPLMVMFEQQEEDQEGMQEENTFEVTEAIPDVELFEYKTSTRSIHVLSGAWVAYSHVDFSGNQYILEKGFYNNCADWGSQDNRICSVQPILLAPNDITRSRNEVILYNEPDFQGQCHVFDLNQEALPERFLIKSCRVSGGSWVFYEEKKFSGNTYVLSEGDYPNLSSMGCLLTSNIRSVKVVPLSFSVPSISLFGLECHEGREITTDTEIISMVEEGFNNHILSVRVNSGCWVICEHSNYRGRQFLLEPIEITNWHKFSSLQTIGSMYPVRQKRHLFRIKNKERGHFLSIQGGVEEMKSGRVVVTPEVEGLSDIWFYQDGLIKSKAAPTMSLQVMGNVEQGAKVVLWSETRQPIQTWTAKLRGMITSLTFPGMVMDVKGGKNYDKDHVVIMPENEERPSQHWEIELL